MPGSPVDISRHSGYTSSSRNVGIGKDGRSDSDDSHSRNNSGSSMFGWMRSNQQKQKTSEAFLGEKNRCYNP